MGESIFGGKMTRMTSGYKNAKQIEREQEEKKKEYENRTVPIEWQGEKFQKKVNKEYDEYMTQLEEKVRLEKERKAMKAAGKSETETGRPALRRPRHLPDRPSLPTTMTPPCQMSWEILWHTSRSEHIYC